MADVSPTLILLNFTDQNSNPKANTVWLCKNRKIQQCTVFQRPTSNQDTNTLKEKGQKTIYHANSNNKTAGVAVISNKVNFKKYY